MVNIISGVSASFSPYYIDASNPSGSNCSSPSACDAVFTQMDGTAIPTDTSYIAAEGSLVRGLRSEVFTKIRAMHSFDFRSLPSATPVQAAPAFLSQVSLTRSCRRLLAARRTMLSANPGATTHVRKKILGFEKFVMFSSDNPVHPKMGDKLWEQKVI